MGQRPKGPPSIRWGGLHPSLDRHCYAGRITGKASCSRKKGRLWLQAGVGAGSYMQSSTVVPLIHSNGQEDHRQGTRCNGSVVATAALWGTRCDDTRAQRTSQGFAPSVQSQAVWCVDLNILAFTVMVNRKEPTDLDNYQGIARPENLLDLLSSNPQHSTQYREPCMICPLQDHLQP
jgi:hypothetical protein